MECGEVETWQEMWSSSESDDSIYSDDSMSCSKMEAVNVSGQNFLLPEDMCDNLNIFKQILSMDTWNSFSEQQKNHLKTFLPEFSEEDGGVKEQERSLEMLFSGENMRFGNPLNQFHDNLKAGYYRPDIAKMRSLLIKTRFKDYKRKEKWRMLKLVKSVLVSRSRLADAVVHGERAATGGSHASRVKNHEANVKARYLQEMQLIKEKMADSDNSSDDSDCLPVYSSMLKRNRRKEYQAGGTCILGTLSPGPNPWDTSKYPSANPYQPIQLSFNQLLSTHYNRKSHGKSLLPDLYTDDITMEEVAQRCKLLKRPPLNSKAIVSKKPKIKSEDGEYLEDVSNGLGIYEGMTIIKQEPDDEPDERVDIEAVDDQPSLNIFNSLIPKAPVSRPPLTSSPGQWQSKVKCESPVDSVARKLTLESMLDEPVTLPHHALLNSHVSTPHLTPSTPAKRSRAESTDSHLRRQVKEIAPLPRKPEHKRSHSLTESKLSRTTPKQSSMETGPKAGRVESVPQAMAKSSARSTDDVRCTGRSPDHILSLSNFKQVKSETPDQLQFLPNFNKLKSEILDKSQALPGFRNIKSGETAEDLIPLPSFKKLKSGEPVDDLLSLSSFKKLKSGEEVDDVILPSFKKLKSEDMDEIVSLTSFKKLKSGENMDDVISSLALPSFKKLKSGEDLEPSFKKLNSDDMDDVISLPSFKKLKSGEDIGELVSLSGFTKPKAGDETEELVPLPSFKKLKSETAEYHRAKLVRDGTMPSSPSGIPLPVTSALSSGQPGQSPGVPPPLKVEPLDPPPQALPSFNIVQPMKCSRVMTPATLSDLDGIDMMALPVDFDTETNLDDMKGKIELKEETQACFFCLIRDVVTSTEDHRMDLVELEARLKAWSASPIAPLNHWYTPDIDKQLLSALFFLTGESTDIVPEDYVPFMEYKVSCNAYQWIGAGRDSDHRLVPLCNLWSERAHATPTQPRPALLIHRPIGFRVDGAGLKEVVLARPGRSGDSSSGEVVHPRGPAVQPSSPRDRHIFRIQEKQRYETPSRAFTYRIGNTEAVVGPVRASNCSSASKARGHTLLAPTRPTCVTILDLVRDAVARLPGSQGTRADIVTLLKDSQYLLEDPVESVLSSVVSGALDRLHSDDDPCVRYDAKRKIWVYLHATRTPEEFERLHALGLESKAQRPKPSRKSAKKKETQPKEIDSSLQQSSISSQLNEKMLLEGSSGNRVAQKVVQSGKAIGASAVDNVLERVTNQANKKNIESSSTARSQVDASVSTLKANNPNKKTLSAGIGNLVSSDKQTKSLVKVLTTTSQPSSSTQGRNIGKQTISAQQVVQLKQQLLAAESKKSAGQQQSQQGIQQQVIVMKGSDQQQMIVISGAPGNQQQFVVEQGVLSAKQHKQIQQMLTKQQEQQHEQRHEQRSTASATITLQQQLQQLILAKQQQLEQQKSENSGISKAGGSSGQQMILVKGGGEGENSSQQMILVSSKGNSTACSGTSQGDLILLKQQQSNEQQTHMIKHATSSQGQQTDVDQQQSQSLQQILVKQQNTNQNELLQQSQGLQQILVKQQSTNQNDMLQQLVKQQSSSQSDMLQQLLIKQLEGPAQQLQQLLVKQSDSVQHVSGGQSTGSNSTSEVQHVMLKQQTQNQDPGQVSLHQLLLKSHSHESSHQVLKSDGQGSSSQGTEHVQLLVKGQGTGSGTDSVQLLVKGQGAGSGGDSIQQISQQQLHQLLLKQQMIIVKQHDQKHIQVIPQNKSVTLAQIQQHKSSAGLLSPRLVTSLGGKTQAGQVVAKVQGSVVSMETLLAAQQKQGVQSGTVNRTSLGQYAVVSLPQQRMQSVSSGDSKQTVTSSSTSSSGTTASTSSSPRLPISMAQLSGKQLLLTSKPTTQNVLLGTTSSGQAVLLHQGSQQILIPSQTLKALHGLKVIPITGSSAHRPAASHQGLRGQGQQVFARLVAPGTSRPMVIQPQSQPQQSEPSSNQPNPE